MQQTREEPRRLTRRDIAAVAAGTAIDAVLEFFRRLNLLRQEIDNARPDSRGSETNRRHS